MEFIFCEKQLNDSIPIRTIDSFGLYIYAEAKIYNLSDNSEIIIIGDCINPEVLFSSEYFNASFLKKAKGIFYLIHICRDQISFYSSFFGLLPIYYHPEKKIISNSLDSIKKRFSLSLSWSKKFFLESYLFNYAFSDETIYRQVKRAPAFTVLTIIKGEIIHEKYEDICNWFCIDTDMKNGRIEKLASYFLEEVKPYFSQRCSITFTSGFDGRTLLSAALLHNADFDTFSWGRLENDDVQNPMRSAEILDIPYKFFDLGSSDFISKFYSLGERLSLRTGGYNGFLYPHFLYGSAEISKYAHSVITGYCGSELFRALHIQGAVTSSDLVNIFKIDEDLKLYDLLWNSPKLIFLNKADYKDVFNEMMDEIISFRKSKPDDLTQNQFFYYYIFTEVFRKVFGSWTTAQFKEIKVRIPFLDFNFIRELLKTDLAGCNNDFFVHNPVKRLKGQLLYAEIIRQSGTSLYEMKTGKGYKPIDLLTVSGKAKIIWPYFRKKIVKKATNQSLDNLGLISGYNFHRDKIENSIRNIEGINEDKFFEISRQINPFMPEQIRDIIFQTASFASVLTP